MSGKRQLKIVSLLEPELCPECRFAKMADVVEQSGNRSRMIYCQRLDCDNWDFGSAQPAKEVLVDNDTCD